MDDDGVERVDDESAPRSPVSVMAVERVEVAETAVFSGSNRGKMEAVRRGASRDKYKGVGKSKIEGEGEGLSKGRSVPAVSKSKSNKSKRSQGVIAERKAAWLSPSLKPGQKGGAAGGSLAVHA